jgi:tetratricopeptide (TPR) repeat protein
MPGIPPSAHSQPDIPPVQISHLKERVKELCRTPNNPKTSSEKYRKSVYHKNRFLFKKPLFGNRFVIPLLGLIFIASLFMGFFSQRTSSNHTHLSYLKGPCPDFIGRQRYIDLLYRDLLQNQNQKDFHHLLKIKVLWGKGGLGKSELAREFAHRFRPSFSLIWTFYCDSQEHMDQGYRDLAEKLGLAKAKESLEIIKEKVHFHLENHSFDRPWLLIFDNVEKEFSFPQRGGSILITSQKQMLNPELRLEMEPFSPEESLALLEKITHEKRGPAMEQLVKDLEGIPLLIYYAAHYIKATPGCDAVDYQKLFAQRLSEKEGPLWIEMDVNRRYFKSLAASWQFPLNSLKKENPQALKWLFVCSYLYPEYIPEEWIDDWLEKPSEIERKELLKALQTYGVIHYEKKTKTFSMHRFFQYMIRESRKNHRQEDLSQVVSLLAQHANDYQFSDYSSWKQGQLWYLHACEAQKWLLQQPQFSQLVRVKEMHFYEGIGNWCDGNNNFQEALGAYKKVLILKESILDRHSPQIGITYNDIAKVLNILSRPAEALQACEKAESLQAHLAGEEALIYARTLLTKGHILSHIGKSKEALNCHQQSLKIRLENLGYFHPNLEYSLNRLEDIANEITHNMALLKQQGRYHEALELHEKIIGIGRSFYNISHCLLKTNQPLQALEIADRILQIYREMLDNKHPYLAWITMKKADCLHDLGNYQQALDLFHEALSLLTTLRGNDHIDLADCWNGIGKCYLQMGKFKKAREAFKNGLRIGLQHEGGKSYLSLEARHGLGSSYIKEGHFKKGLRCLLAELKTSAEVYKNTPKIAALLQEFNAQLKEAAGKIGKTDEIKQAAAEAYSMSADALGLHHSVTESFL